MIRKMQPVIVSAKLTRRSFVRGVLEVNVDHVIVSDMVHWRGRGHRCCRFGKWVNGKKWLIVWNEHDYLQRKGLI